MRAIGRTLIMLCVVGALPAAATEPQKPSAPSGPTPDEQLTLEKFGEANKTCLQWSDGCAVCKRRDDGSFGCSVTGIACQPSSLTCRQTKQDAKPAGEPEKPKK